MRILMVAAENAALPGGKVGGIGDVIRDIPRALAQLGHQVDVVIPGYQRFSKLPEATRTGAIEACFRGINEHVEIFQLPGSNHTNLRCWALEHPLFAPCGSGRIYCDDPASSPFATDASKFALFSTAVTQAALQQVWGKLDVIHLHDWHAALVALLVRFDPSCKPLNKIPLVYTIHNLSLQGIRPFSGDESSLQAWFPQLLANPEKIRDPRFPQCINPMRVGINLCDKVQAVSPTYAQEIQAPSNPLSGYVGGEGLEDDLRLAAAEGKLHGILNGCDYADSTSQRLQFPELMAIIEQQMEQWLASNPIPVSSHLLALRKIDKWRRDVDPKAPGIVVTSVGRLTNQKVRLLLGTMADGRTAMDHLLDTLHNKGLMILLGSGDITLQQQMTEVMARHNNLLFLQGYSDALPDKLYASGDLFLMPSSFEPCGISQMLAMRSGQPCLVHHVGGLVDTVTDRVDGFAFNGPSEPEKRQHMISCFSDAITLFAKRDAKSKQKINWQTICQNAASKRFLWSTIAEQYVSSLYSTNAD